MYTIFLKKIQYHRSSLKGLQHLFYSIGHIQITLEIMFNLMGTPHIHLQKYFI